MPFHRLKLSYLCLNPTYLIPEKARVALILSTACQVSMPHSPWVVVIHSRVIRTIHNCGVGDGGGELGADPWLSDSGLGGWAGELFRL